MTRWVWLVATIVVYAGILRIHARHRRLYTIPILVAAVVLGAAVLAAGGRFDDYAAGTAPLSWLLGPATVALAVPLVRERAILVRHAGAVVVGTSAGAAAALATAVLLARALGLPALFVRSVAAKGVTTPVALAVAEQVGGSLEITAAAVVGTGIFGIAFGARILTWARVRSPLARGIGLGTGAHAMGTAAALDEGATPGAAAVVAMVLAAIVTALLAGPALRWLG